MSWLVLTAISVVFRAIYGVMTKVLSNKLNVSVYTQATLLPLAGAAISILISPLLGGLNFDLSNVSLIAIILVVVGQGLGNIAYFEAIKNLTNSTAQIAFSSILVFNTVLSLLFLNLHLGWLNALGIFILMVAILSVTTGKVELHKKGVAWMLLSAFLFAVFQLSSAEVSRQISAVSYLTITYLGAATVVVVVKLRAIVSDLARMRPLGTNLGIPLAAAIPSIGNFLFAYYAYRIAPTPAKVAILLTSQVVLTVFLSYFLLKEKDNLIRKLAASALVVVAALMIKN